MDELLKLAEHDGGSFSELDIRRTKAQPPPTSTAPPFTPTQFHALLKSLFKVQSMKDKTLSKLRGLSKYILVK